MMKAKQGMKIWRVAVAERIAAGFAVILLMLLPPIPSYAYEASLVGYWNLDEASGTTANDATANNLDGTLTNGVVLNQAGKFGQAYSFDGTNDYVYGAKNDLLRNMSAITVSAWIKRDVSGVYSIPISYDGNSCGAYNISIYGDNTAGFSISNNSVWVGSGGSTTALTSGVWYLVTGVWDGTNAKIYVNGVNEHSLVTTGVTSLGGTDADDRLRMGRDGWDSGPSYLDGSLDDVAIFSRALSADEIRYLGSGSGNSVETFETAYASYGTTSGNWDTDANWRAGIEPTASVNAHIDSGATVTVSASGEVANNVYIGDVSGESGTLNINTGGTLTVSGTIIDGAGTSTIAINGGTLSVTGTTISVDNFYIGNVATGSYTLTTGKTINAGVESIGQMGTGTFTQSGGTNSGSTSIVVGNAATGTYNLSGGTLTGGYVLLGGQTGGVGTLNQTGGTATAGTLYLGWNWSGGGTGTYNLQGGTLNVGAGNIQNSAEGTGALNIDGGTLAGAWTTMAVDNLGVGYTTAGSFSMDGTKTINAGIERIGWGATGNFTQSGGTNSMSDSLVVGGAATGTYNLNGGTLSASSYEVVGTSAGGVGTINQTGGTNTTTTLYIGWNWSAGSTGTYNLKGGTLNVGAGNIQNAAEGTSTFNIDGGTLSGTYTTIGVDNLNIGNTAAGSYTLTTGKTINATNESVGNFNGTNTFTHTAGANNVGTLTLGYGTYNLNGGTLNVTGNIVNGTGTSTMNIASNFTVASTKSMAVDVLNVSAGTLNAGSASALDVNGNLTISGTGSLTAPVSGGSFTVGGNWSNASTFTPGTGTVTFDAGSGTQTLNSGGTVAGKTFNNITHSGAGTLQLVTNNAVASGTLTQSAGTIDLNSKGLTAGTLSMSGGTLSGGTLTGSSFALTDSGTISSILAGTGALTKSGTGTATLSGANTYSGVTTVDLGVLAISNANSLGNTTGNTVVNSGDLSTPGGVLKVGGGITVNEALTISGQGNSSLDGALQNTSGANTWAGAITLSDRSDSRIYVVSGSLNITGGIGTTGTKILYLVPAGGTTLTVSSSPISIAGNSILSHGTGTTLLNVGGNTFGGVYVQYGNTFKIGVNDALSTSGDLVLGNTASGGESGTFDLNGYNQTVDQLGSGSASGGTISAGTRTVTNSAAGTSKTLTVGNAGGSSLFDGVIENGSGTISFTKVGTGTQTLAGSSTYSGVTTVDMGVLAITNGNALGNTSGNTVVNTVDGIVNGGQLQISGSITVNEALTINGHGSGNYNGALDSTSGNNTWSGAITVGASANGSRVGITSGSLNLTGGISGSQYLCLLPWNAGTTLTVSTNPISLGTKHVQSAGAGTTVLNVGGNTFSAVILQYGNIFKIGLNDALPTSADLILGSTVSTAESATFDLHGYNQTVDQLGSGSASGGTISAGTRTVTNSAAGTSKTLTVGNANGTSLFDGIIENGSGTVGLTKTGTGNQTLSGVNTYTGATTISGGTLTLDATGTIAASSGVANSGNLTIGGNKTIDSMTGAGTTTLGSYTLTIGDASNTSGTYSGIASGTGGITKAGTGTLTLSGGNTYTGATSVTAGILQLSATGALGNGTNNTSGVTVSNLAALDLNGTTPTANAALNINGTTGTATVGALTNSSGTAATYGGAVTLQSASSIGSSSGNITLSNTLSGAYGLTKVGTDVLTLTGSTNGTTTTTISAGTLQVGSGSTTGALGSGAVTNSGALKINRSNAYTLSNAISGTGALIQAGTGTLTLSGSNSYSGATTVSAGTLQISAANNLGSGVSGNNIIFNGGTLYSTANTYSLGANRTITLQSGGGAFSVDGAVTVDGVISGTGTFYKGAGGTLVLSGNNTFGGQLTVGNGYLSIASINNDSANGVLGNSALSVGLGNSNNGAIGTIQYTGSTASSTKKFTVNSDAGGAFQIDNASTNLTLSGAIDGGGTLAKTGAGALTFSGNNTYSGATTVSAGALNIQNANALGGTAAGTSVTSGAALQIQGGITTAAEALALNGAGVSGSGGALRSISGDNTYAGAVTLGSTSRINSDANTLTLNGGITGGTYGLTFGGAGNVTVSSAISGSGAMTKDGTGILTLSGSNTSYTGVTTVDMGVLSITNANALGGTGGNTVVNSGNGTTAGGQLQVSGGITVAEPITISGVGNSGWNGALRSTSGDNTWSGTITLGTATYSRIEIGSGSNLNITNGIGGTGTQFLLLVPMAIGTTLTVSGTAPTSSISIGSNVVHSQGFGTTVLSVGGNAFSEINVNFSNTFKIGVSDALPTSSDLIIGDPRSGAETGTFNLNGFNQTVDQLGSGTAAGQVIAAGTRKVTNSTATSKTLTVGNANGTSLFDGVIENGSGTVGLTKVGSGTQTLTRSNTYTDLPHLVVPA